MLIIIFIKIFHCILKLVRAFFSQDIQMKCRHLLDRVGKCRPSFWDPPTNDSTLSIGLNLEYWYLIGRVIIRQPINVFVYNDAQRS